MSPPFSALLARPVKVIVPAGRKHICFDDSATKFTRTQRPNTKRLLAAFKANPWMTSQEARLLITGMDVSEAVGRAWRSGFLVRVGGKPFRWALSVEGEKVIMFP